MAKITWHRIPEIPGPHLFRYLWWFGTNQLWRWRDRRWRGLDCDAVYSPGINCFDADAVVVHVVFAELAERVREELRFRKNPLLSWPRVLHRRLYYKLISALEHRIYGRDDVVLGAVSRQVAEQLSRRFAPREVPRVLYLGVDTSLFNPQRRLARRAEARGRLKLSDRDFVLLLIGNGWRNKGLPCLLEALGELRELPAKLLVVGNDDHAPFREICTRLALGNRVRFLEPAAEVLEFYAAADVYVSPSLHDSFALPPLEAMACGLPVITSRRNGGSEIMTHESDALVLEDPADAHELARFIRRLGSDPRLCQSLGENAARTAAQFTWARHAEATRTLLLEAVKRRKAS